MIERYYRVGAHPYLDDGVVYLLIAEVAEGHERRELEEGGPQLRDLRSGALGEAYDVVLVNRLAIDAYALAEV